MSEEKDDKKTQDEDYEGIRADVDTAIYAFKTLEEIDAAILGKNIATKISKTKESCLYIIFNGIEALRNSYEE